MRSTKMTVTTLRSSGGGAPTGYPQFGQNRASSGSGSPHRSHVGLPTAAVYGRPAPRASGLALGDPEAVDVQDRACALGVCPQDDLDALAYLEGLLVGGIEHTVEHHGVGAVQAHEAEDLRRRELLTVHVDEGDR